MQIIIKTALKSSLFEDFFVYIVQSCYVSYNLIIVAKPLGLFSIYSGTFNFLLIFYNEFSCSLAFQLSFLFQTSNPKHFSFVGLITLNFVAFILILTSFLYIWLLKPLLCLPLHCLLLLVYFHLNIKPTLISYSCSSSQVVPLFHISPCEISGLLWNSSTNTLFRDFHPSIGTCPIIQYSKQTKTCPL